MRPVHHVGVTVSDLDRAVAFYRDVLGLDVRQRFSVGGDAFATAVGVPDAAASFAHLDGGGVRVELVEYDPTGERTTPAALDQPDASHLGLSVDDVDAFYADLPAGVETLSEPRTTESGARILFLCDSEDNLIEVLDA